VEDHSGVVRQLLKAGAFARTDTLEVDGRLAFRDVAAVRADELPPLSFQRVPEAKAAKNGCHVDVPVGPEHADAGRDRLVALGGPCSCGPRAIEDRYRTRCRTRRATSPASAELPARTDDLVLLDADAPPRGRSRASEEDLWIAGSHQSEGTPPELMPSSATG
jgi:hypothetical protein